MESDYKIACILFDENDLEDFKNSYKNIIPEGSLWVPLDTFPTMQVVLQETGKPYYIPRIINDDEFSTGMIYAESQEFLKQLLLANKMIDESDKFFPLEHFWFCLWNKIYRTLSFCNDVINQFNIKEIIIIRRNKYLNHGGILTHTASFVDLVDKFFKNRNVIVKIYKCQNDYVKPKTIFYDQKQNLLKSSLKQAKHWLAFIKWKTLSFSKKNCNHILIKPNYDNIVNYQKIFDSDDNKNVPQIFHGLKIPFLYSCKKMLCYLIRKPFFLFTHSDSNINVLEVYKLNAYNFEFDFTELFKETIINYLKDTRWMENYIKTLWDSCFRKQERDLIIFSLSPVHLDSYFLIKKAKKNLGKIAVWQHGGVYGYTDYPAHYLTDYKNIDYFLSYGVNNISVITKYFPDSSTPKNFPVGTHKMYKKLDTKKAYSRKLWNEKGLFIPMVMSPVYKQENISLRMDLQLKSVKNVIDYFGEGSDIKLAIKGLKGNKIHYQLCKYIEFKNFKNISYTEIVLDRALAYNPKFIIIDDTSTPLLQVLAKYNGPIFLILNQKTLMPREDALALLKKRIVCSESVDELKMQLTKFINEGDLGEVDLEDSSFIDMYVKNFSYPDYKRFLQETTSSLPATRRE
jgi:hypothetical protein